MEFIQVISSVKNIISGVLSGFKILIEFVFQYIDFIPKIFDSLPYGLGGVILAVFSVSFVVVILKAIV